MFVQVRCSFSTKKSVQEKSVPEKSGHGAGKSSCESNRTFMSLREGPSLLLAKVPDRIGRIGIFLSKIKDFYDGPPIINAKYCL